MFVKIVIFALLISLAACSGTNDPRDGGLLGGLQGIYGGGYDYRVQQRQEKIAEQERLNHNLSEKSEILKKELHLKDSQLASDQQRMLMLERQVFDLESSVKKLHAKSNIQKGDLVNINLRVEDLKNYLNTQKSAISELDKRGGVSADLERYQILQQERDRLFEEYIKLLDYIQALSEANS